MEAFKKMFLEYPQLMYGGVGATAFVTGGALIYRIATRKKPTHISVNCWFCNQDTVVPYGNRNCWDCPNCDQYNGFQENGDYNKPIPAQYTEHLNHGVSAELPLPEAPKVQQWVNCQMLLCKKCNNNQTLKIKQLAQFIPRNHENYDEEIEVYRHHLEQTYKLCRPCQAAVEYYIKHQNRQLRAHLFNHQLRRGRDADKTLVQATQCLSTPAGVILLRVLAFFTCAFLLAAMAYESDLLPGGFAPPAPPPRNSSTSAQGDGGQLWSGVAALLPDEALEHVRIVWEYGRGHQMAVASTGFLTCVTGVFLAGPSRLRRIDAVATLAWLVVLCLYLAEGYIATSATFWTDAAKLAATSLCCLIGFAAAVATRKSAGTRRARGRRSESEQ